ncbi:hypothetical protein GOODEAATRI_008005 [Goodea atripinnis]|uniref:Uncharacterized protein n=1 Tax=Goodea atripinnis TaxID=208336 RepID=A0ABV0PLQ6_9TELE
MQIKIFPLNIEKGKCNYLTFFKEVMCFIEMANKISSGSGVRSSWTCSTETWHPDWLPHNKLSRFRERLTQSGCMEAASGKIFSHPNPMRVLRFANEHRGRV